MARINDDIPLTAPASAKDQIAPWLKRRDWCNGVLRSSSIGTVAAAWLSVAVATLISGVFFTIYFNHAVGTKPPPGILLFVFGAVTLAFWAGAVYSTVRHLKFGGITFHLGENPGVLGGLLKGEIRIPNPYPLQNSKIEIILSCLKLVSMPTGGKSATRSTRETVLWRTVKHLRLEGTPRQLPVEFAIPYTCLPVSDQPPERIVWRLSLAAEVKGADLNLSFDVPVFKTATSNPAVDESTVAPEVRLDEMPAALQRCGILVQRGGHGQLRIVAPPAAQRTGKLVFGFGLFLAGWTGAIVLLFVFNAPLLLILVFMLMETLAGFILLAVFFQQITTTVSLGRIRRETAIFSWIRQQEVTATEILDVKTGIGMSSNSPNRQTAYYDVKILFKPSGSKPTQPLLVAGMLKEPEVAEFLAEQIRQALIPAPSTEI